MHKNFLIKHLTASNHAAFYVSFISYCQPKLFKLSFGKCNNKMPSCIKIRMNYNINNKTKQPKPSHKTIIQKQTCLFIHMLSKLQSPYAFSCTNINSEHFLMTCERKLLMHYWPTQHKHIMEPLLVLLPAGDDVVVEVVTLLGFAANVVGVIRVGISMLTEDVRLPVELETRLVPFAVHLDVLHRLSLQHFARQSRSVTVNTCKCESLFKERVKHNISTVSRFEAN